MPAIIYIVAVVGTVLASAAGVAALAVLCAVVAAVLVFRKELAPLKGWAQGLLPEHRRTDP